MNRGAASPARRLTRAARRLLTANRASPPAHELWAAQRRATTLAPVLVRIFYAALLANFINRYDAWESWLSLDRIRLLWPIGWFDLVGVRSGIAIVIFGAPVAALLALA